MTTRRIAWGVLVSTIALFGCQGRQQPAPVASLRPAALTAAGANIPLPGLPGPGPARVVVKVQAAVDQGLIRVLRPGSGAVDLGSAAAALFSRVGARSALAVYPGRALLRAQGLSGTALGAGVSQRFAARQARAPRGAVAPDLDGLYSLDLGDRSAGEVDAVLAILRADPSVVWAERDNVVRPSFVPNDPRLGELYGLSRLGATAAWDTSRGAGVVVAVVDTGVDYTHPDIDGNVWINSGEIAGNGIDDDHNGFIDDVRGWDFVGASVGAPTPDNDPIDRAGHGSHVAGTIAAEGNNGVGVVGVAFAARVLIAKGFDDSAGGVDSFLASAVVYATDQGADVINASWGGPPSQTIQDAVAYAHSHGVVFVAAAGNDTQDANLTTPSGLPQAITVSATDSSDQLASFSNFGSKIDVAAPGVDILSLEAGTGGYRLLSGTSMAAPHVSGVAALILAAHPTFTVEQVRQVLRTTATDLGAPGKDPSFGYGRVSAAGAVLASGALEAKILSPADGAVISSATTFTGSAAGPGLQSWTLEYGAGASPAAWTTLGSGTSAVSEGALGALDPATLGDGLYTVRLRALDAGGATFSDQIQIVLRVITISSPVPGVIPSEISTFKPGSPIEVIGTSASPGFQHYTVDWAPGRDAQSGFSTAGVTLPGGGTSPVTAGDLAFWTPPAAARGEHTIRLVVTDSGITRTATTVVYLEPDLVSSSWPRFQQDVTFQGPVAARRADGATRLIVCGTGGFGTGGRNCSSYGSDGTGPTLFHLAVGSFIKPSAANLDGQPGDEVVVPEMRTLHVLTPDLALVRDITTTAAHVFAVDQIIVSDLDGDGSPEIVAPARDTQLPGTFRESGALYVYRGDGRLYSSNYPRTITTPTTGTGYGQVNVVAIDLDGDGKKEVVFAVLDLNGTDVSVQAVHADGTAVSGWLNPHFASAGGVSRIAAADLDHDGHPEIAVGHTLPGGTSELILYDQTGQVRPNWPVFDAGRVLAIGDLDRDGQSELITAGTRGFFVLRANGSRVQQPWPDTPQIESPLVADIDGDGFPEVVVASLTSVTPSGAPAYGDQRIQAYDRNARLVREWKIFGFQGHQPNIPVPAIGEMTGDGKTDIALMTPIVSGDNYFGVHLVLGGALEVLTSGAPFNAANADWPTPFGDAGNAEVPAQAPLSTLSAAADANVFDGDKTANFGSDSSLVVKTSSAGSNYISYLRFPLGGLSSTVGAARLRIYGSRFGSTHVTDSAFAVSSNSWTESGINWNNKPALGARQGAALEVGQAAGYYEWDVTAFVRSQKAAGVSAVSLAVKMDSSIGSDPADVFNSKEAFDNPPRLVVTVSSDAPPTVATPASVSPSPVNGTTAALSVLGADDHGEAALSYTWSSVPPVTFSANGTNAAKHTTATFPGPGNYSFTVVIRDALGQTTSSPTTVLVNQTLTSVAVTPATATVAAGGTQAFTAAARDQFGADFPTTFTWSVSGGGSIDASGLFRAGASAGGPFSVTASSGGKSGTAAVTVSGGGGSLTIAPVADAYVRDGTSAGNNFGTDTVLAVKTTTASNATRVTYLRFPLTGVTTASAATLRLFGSRGTSTSATDSAFAVASTTWTETGLTWNNRPPLGARQGAAQAITPTARYYQWDVTAFVQAQKAAGATAVSLAVSMDVPVTDSPDGFNSKEASSNPPQLVVTP
jgi:subtilisin family serine protease